MLHQSIACTISKPCVPSAAQRPSQQTWLLEAARLASAAEHMGCIMCVEHVRFRSSAGQHGQQCCMAPCMHVMHTCKRGPRSHLLLRIDFRTCILDNISFASRIATTSLRVRSYDRLSVIYYVCIPLIWRLSIPGWLATFQSCPFAMPMPECYTTMLCGFVVLQLASGRSSEPRSAVPPVLESVVM